MQRIFFIESICLYILLLFTSCSRKSDDSTAPVSSLINTKWHLVAFSKTDSSYQLLETLPGFPGVYNILINEHQNYENEILTQSFDSVIYNDENSIIKESLIEHSYKYSFNIEFKDYNDVFWLDYIAYDEKNNEINFTEWGYFNLGPDGNTLYFEAAFNQLIPIMFPCRYKISSIEDGFKLDYEIDEKLGETSFRKLNYSAVFKRTE